MSFEVILPLNQTFTLIYMTLIGNETALPPEGGFKVMIYTFQTTSKYFFEKLLTEWEHTVITEIAEQFPEAYNRAIAFLFDFLS
jgi:hypothetical protein